MIRINKKLCFYCGTCANICPQAAIELNDCDGVEIGEECIEHICRKYNCRLCVKVCPLGALYGD